MNEVNKFTKGEHETYNRALECHINVISAHILALRALAEQCTDNDCKFLKKTYRESIAEILKHHLEENK